VTLTLDEAAVCAGLLVDPAGCAPIAWAFCQPDDLEDERLRFLYSLIVTAWLDGMQEPGPRFPWLVRGMFTGRFGLSADEGAAWCDSLVDDYGALAGRIVYEWHAQRVGARGSVRRVGALVERWWLRLRPLTWRAPHVATVPAEALTESPRDARALLARLLRELRAARRTAVEPPMVHVVGPRKLDPW
jgi:hypothetical protein